MITAMLPNSEVLEVQLDCSEPMPMPKFIFY